MQTDIHLLHIDARHNMQRFYTLSLQPTLFGDIALMRQWGRIGTKGQMKMQSFAGQTAARTALKKLQTQKIKRGYRQLPDGNRGIIP